MTICQCLTLKQRQCTREALPGSDFCWQHWNCQNPISSLPSLSSLPSNASSRIWSKASSRAPTKNRASAKASSKASAKASSRISQEFEDERQHLLKESPLYQEYLQFTDNLNPYLDVKKPSYEDFGDIYSRAIRNYENENAAREDASIDELNDNEKQEYLENAAEELGFLSFGSE